MMRVIILLAALIISMQAKSQFAVSGKISDENGKPLAGANIHIENTYTGTITDPAGNYSMKKVTPGEKTFVASYTGYESGKTTIDIDGNESLNFVLKPARILGEEAIIKGVRAGVKDPVAFTSITREDIEEGNTGKDIPFLLSLTPSVVTTSDAGAGIGYTGFRIRGTDANRINITVNGIPLNDAESHGVWFVNMPDFVSSVDNIQIQRGVGTSTNGAGAFGASLNFQTLANNSKPYALIDNSLGSFRTYRNSVMFGTGMIDDRFTFDARLSGIHSDGYIDRASSDLSSWFVSGGWHSGKSLLKLNVFSGEEKTYQAWDGVPSNMLDSVRTFNGIGKYTDENGEVRYYANETDNYNQSHYQLHYSHQLTRTVNFSGALHLTRGLGYYEQYKEDEDLDAYRIPEIQTDDTISASDLVRRKYLDNYFYGTILSLSLTKETFGLIIGGGLNQYRGDHYGTVIWARNAGVSEINHKWYENNSLKTDFNIYSRLNYRLGYAINLYSDIQVRGINYEMAGDDDDLRDITQEHSFFFFNPKLGFNYQINDNQRTFFSFSVANREPNRDNFTDASPEQPSPSHETLYDYELGYEISHNSFTAGINMYYMDYNNQLVLTGAINDVGSPIMTNVKDSNRKGVEFLFGSKFLEDLMWNFNFTLSSNKIKNFISYVDNWNYWDDPANQQFQLTENIGVTDISFSPSVIAGNTLKFQAFKGFNISLQSKYVGPQYIDNTSSDERKLDAWFVNDLRMDYTFRTKKAGEFSVNLLIANLFNEEYESNAWVYRYFYNGSEDKIDGYFPQAGINFLAGLKIKF